MSVETKTLNSLLILMLLLTTSRAEDWPQFLGPKADGIHSSAVPTKWSDENNITWKTLLPGPGSSSPIISSGRIFVASYSGYGLDPSSPGELDDLQRHLNCYNPASGEKLWQQDVQAVLPEDPYTGFLREHGYASSTPVSDGENVFVFFGKSGVHAFSHGGRKLWQTSVGRESGNRRWGSAASPVLFGDKIIVNASEESQSIRALDKKTGKELWKAEGSILELVYTTPRVVTFSNGRSDIVVPAPGEIWGINPDTGKLRWFAETPIPGNVSPSVQVNGDLIYAFGGYPQRFTIALKAGDKGDLTSNIKWTQRRAPYIPTPVLFEGHLYWMDRSGVAYCARESDGELVYQERIRAGRSGIKNYASPVVAGGMIYYSTRNAGTFVIEASPKFRQIDHNVISSDPSDFSATPAFHENQIFLRSGRYLYCISD